MNGLAFAWSKWAAHSLPTPHQFRWAGRPVPKKPAQACAGGPKATVGSWAGGWAAGLWEHTYIWKLESHFFLSRADGSRGLVGQSPRNFGKSRKQKIFHWNALDHYWDIVSAIIDSGPMCITDLFQNSYLAQNKILLIIFKIISHLYAM